MHARALKAGSWALLPTCPTLCHGKTCRKSKLRADSCPVSLAATLWSGQCFRWTPSPVPPSSWVGVIQSTVYELREDAEQQLLFRVWHAAEGTDPMDGRHVDVLRNFFSLDVDLCGLYQNEWMKHQRHPLVTMLKSNVEEGERVKLGTRLLRQDPFEVLITFLCTQNNNVKRIRGMVERMCATYGTPLGTVPLGDTTKLMYAFPSLSQLRNASEEALVKQGFGYRAPYIVGAVRALSQDASSEQEWSRAMERLSCQELREKLIALPGVGRKVADCVLLFGFQHTAIVPIDTHMASIATNLILPRLKVRPSSSLPLLASEEKLCSMMKEGKLKSLTAAAKEGAKVSMTPQLHERFQDIYEEVFGRYAGWAHSFLFASRIATLQ